MQKIYDVCIVGWWASGLFCAINLPATLSKLILEKNTHCAVKVLLSWWERCNVSNIYCAPEAYVSENKKMLPSIFHAWGPQDMVERLAARGVETVVEDRGRIVLKSWKAKQLAELLVSEAVKNDTEIKTDTTVQWLEYLADEACFLLHTSQGDIHAKRVILSSWGKSYPQVGATDLAFQLAQQFWLEINMPYACLCGIEMIEDVSALAGTTIDARVFIKSKNKIVYEEQWPVLFTHRWLSWPVIFNASVFIGHTENITLHIFPEQYTKRMKSLWIIQKELTYTMKSLRSRAEAKVTWWWISMSELKQNFESKKNPWLYIIGEACDITGKTWWYNLQRARSSAKVCAGGVE